MERDPNGAARTCRVLLGFSFAQAQGRYDTRRELFIKEANAIDASSQRAALTAHVPLAAVVLTLSLIFIAVFSLGLSFARAGARPAVFSLIYIAALTLVFEMIPPLQRQLESMRP